MCGIAGVFYPRSRPREMDLGALAAAMAEKLRHRGPDSGGVWADEDAGIALGHRRLAIVDLSPEGRQPMTSADGRYVIAFNGEIYNHARLRAELINAGHRLRGHSDTEVLLALVQSRGVLAALEAAAGMFAVAVWDRDSRVLHLARDRLGKKPLYVGAVQGGVCFASELKSLVDVPGFSGEIDRAALALYLAHQYVPAPHTIWRGIRKLPAGSLLQCRFGSGDCLEDLDACMQSYWRAGPAAQPSRMIENEHEALSSLEAVLGQAVAERMVADVPVGAFLSGGIDSSLVVAMMQEQSSIPVRTFTVGFAETGFDEAPKARAVAKHLRTDHLEVQITPAEAREVIPLLPEIYDEPFADSSQIPTWHLARVARSEVTVCLSGDGGDESFGGYGRYLLALELERRLRPVPASLRQLAARAIQSVPISGWDHLLRAIPFGPPAGFRGAMSGDRLHKLATVIAAADADSRYAALLGVGSIDVVAIEGDRPREAAADNCRVADYVHRMMLHDTRGYLPDDVLTKVDRASMAVSLEVRSPLLDHRVVELAWRTPASMKICGGKGKWLLRELLQRRLPMHLVDPGKAGFGVPVGEWMRGPLRAWCESLLDADRMHAEGYLKVPVVRALWASHCSGERNHAAILWSILMFQAWLSRWSSRPARAEDAALVA